MPAYLLSTPPIAVGANKLLLDLFNAAGSGKVLDIRGVWLCPKLDAAVTGAVAVEGDLFRTSAIGTGGTAASRDSATVDAAGGNFVEFVEADADLPAQVTARVAPTGGATISRWLRPWSYFPEETSPAAYLSQSDSIVPACWGDGMRLAVPEGTGLLLKQSGIASVGSVAIVIAFSTL